ncbi:MAG TPA: dephospho-CoA kinase [Flavisolibacter sp.]
MLKIGLTGGIGSGKTTVAKIFELLRVPVYYADTASKRLYDTNAELADGIMKAFGPSVFSDGRIDRVAMAKLVFNDPQKLRLLNELVHPLTIKDAEDWMRRQTAAYVIKEAALIFESGSGSTLDAIIGVRCPEAVRIERVMKRDGLSEAEVRSRMRHQIDEDVKMKLCDYLIDNDEQSLVIPQVLQLHEKLNQISIAKGAALL